MNFAGINSGIANVSFEKSILYAPRQTAQTEGIVYGCGDNRICGGKYNGTSVDFTKQAYDSLPSSVSYPGLYLSNLFAKTNKVFSLGTNLSNTYTEDNTLNYNKTEGSSPTNPNYLKAPRIRAVQTDTCTTNNLCLESTDDTLTINNQVGGDVLIYSNPGLAVMKFYALADKNQMPIRSIRVDWNDENPIISKLGMFGNYRGLEDGQCLNSKIITDKKTCYVRSDDLDYTKKYPEGIDGYDTKITCESNKDCEKLPICSTDSSKTINFGRFKDACTNTFLRYTNTYSCNQYSKNFKSQCTENPTIQSKFPNGCCVFHPSRAGGHRRTRHIASPPTPTPPPRSQSVDREGVRHLIQQNYVCNSNNFYFSSNTFNLY